MARDVPGVSETKIRFERNPDNSEHLYIGDKLHLVRIAAGPAGCYWYGGGGTGGKDAEELWKSAYKKYEEQGRSKKPKA